MSAYDDLLGEVQDLLAEGGMRGLRVQKLELSPEDLQPDVYLKEDDITKKISRRLLQKGYGQFRVKTLDLGLGLATVTCPPGTEPTYVTKVDENGNITSSIECVKK